jgi:hypothetical protein
MQFLSFDKHKENHIEEANWESDYKENKHNIAMKIVKSKH